LAYEWRAPSPRAETSHPSGERRPGRTREGRFTADLTAAGPPRTNAFDEGQPALRGGWAFG
jgi:hypothetical protein